MFANKVVIVTGAGTGIGAGIAECFAKEHASLAIVGRREAKLQEVARLCEDLGAQVLVIKADVTVDAATIITKTINKYGKIDVLVNNAGITRFGTILEPTMMQFFDEVLNTNLRAVVELTHLAVPHLVATKGNVINISSVLAMSIIAGMGQYCISKAALDQFTKCTAAELATKGVRVNSVNPGPVKSEIQDAFLASDIMAGKKIEDETMLGRSSVGTEVGDLVVYLASDKARGITGSSYVIDNGMLLK